jgi:trigger factor
LIERGIDSQIQRASYSLAMQGIDISKTGLDLGAMRDRLRSGAADEVRGQLLLETIAEKESLEVGDADVDARIAELARMQNKAPNKLKAEMDKEGTLASLRWRMRQEKALDLVVSRATITETDEVPAPEPSEET